MSRLILSPDRAEAKLRRMACKIVEDHYDVAQVVLVGVGRHGATIGERLSWHAQTFAPGKVVFETDLHRAKRADACYVLADGVLFTGETMRWATAEMSDFQPVSVKIAVLVDRGHAKWPLKADYVGLHLATTLRDYVRIETNNQGYHVFLD